MKRNVSPLGKLFLHPLLAFLLVLSGCAQRKAFYFTPPVAQAQAVSTAPSRDSAQSSEVATSIAVTASQETYLPEASLAQPAPVKFSASYTASSAVSGRAMEPIKSDKLGKRLLELQNRPDKARAQQEPAPSSLPLPLSSKAALVLMAISVIALGMLFIPTLSLGAYVLAIMIGFGTFIPAVVTALNGKSKATKNPEKYNERGARNVRSLMLTLTAVLALIVLIAFAI